MTKANTEELVEALQRYEQIFGVMKPHRSGPYVKFEDVKSLLSTKAEDSNSVEEFKEYVRDTLDTFSNGNEYKQIGEDEFGAIARSIANKLNHILSTYPQQETDYHEGLSEGIKIGRAEVESERFADTGKTIESEEGDGITRRRFIEISKGVHEIIGDLNPDRLFGSISLHHEIEPMFKPPHNTQEAKQTKEGE